MRAPQAGLLLDAAAHKFDEYASRVIAFLEPSHAEIYAGRAAWDAMQEDVILRLEALE